MFDNILCKQSRTNKKKQKLLETKNKSIFGDIIHIFRPKKSRNLWKNTAFSPLQKEKNFQNFFDIVPVGKTANETTGKKPINHEMRKKSRIEPYQRKTPVQRQNVGFMISLQILDVCLLFWKLVLAKLLKNR